MERLAQAGRAAAGAVAAARRRRADRNAQAICPTDSWAFTPLYTDGVCPLCGWAPQGYTHVAPPLTRYERYWGAMAAIAAVSVMMCAAVVVAATRG
jgi:hypothetical protein